MGDTIAPGGLFQFGGVPVSSGDLPSFGKVWFVDGANGSVGGSGYTTDDAISTATLGLTAQIAEAKALGDIIYVMPGTYAESITGNLTKVQIIGAGRSGVRPLAKVHPTTSYGYTGEMTDSGFRNLEFATPITGGSPEYPAICITGTTYVMVRSFIDRCFFYNTNDNTTTAGDEAVGIMIGTHAAGNTTYEYWESSEVTNNVFGSVGGVKKQLAVAISMASQQTTAGGMAYKGASNCLIAGNRMMLKTTGIVFHTPVTGCAGTVITRNIIGSMQSTEGVQFYGVEFAGAEADQLCMVVGNWINAGAAAVYNGNTSGNVLDNWCGEAGVETLVEAIA